ncbi:MAG: PIN domain-containing protein [Alphaproteobacteria bacterium]|nr:PIN domain-containing protein [Alphaproteobacteria bacterium]
MKKKVFLDTNVFIDYLGSRNDYAAASMIISLAQKGYFDLLVSSLSFATASYILNAHHKRTNDDIVAMFATFVKKCNVTPVDSIVISNAIASGFSDFEDAMQYYSALREGADAIITRNPNDFRTAKINIFEPQEFLDMLI